MKIKLFVIPVPVKLSTIKNYVNGKYYLNPIILALNTHFGFEEMYQFVFRLKYSHNLRARTQTIRLLVLDLGDAVEYKLDEASRRKYLLLRKRKMCMPFVYKFSVTEKGLHLIYRAQMRMRIEHKGMPTTYTHDEYRT